MSLFHDGTHRTSGPSLGAPLLEHLGRLFGEPSELDAFRHWFSNALWDIESGRSEASEDIVDLFYGVENLLGVFDAGYWTTDQLIVELRKRVALQMLADGLLFDATIGAFEFAERPLLLVPEMGGRGVVRANMNGGTA